MNIEKCSFITKKNKCCTRRSIYTSSYCWQHTDNKETCTICLEKVGNHKKFKISCNHTFHKKCISKWMKHSYGCPLCRNTLTDYELTLLGVKQTVQKSIEINEEMFNELLLVLYIIDTLFEQDEDI